MISKFSEWAVAGVWNASAADAQERERQRQENLAIAVGLKQQDAGLLDELITRYQHRLLRYLLYLAGERNLAEDLFQEVWIRVLTRGGQFNGRARFDTWLFRIARNLFIDHRRKRTMVSLDELLQGGADESSVPWEIADGDSIWSSGADGSGAAGPLQQLLVGEDRERVAEALLALGSTYREVLVLRFHEQMSLEEIAQVTEAPLSTVKSRLYRGMAAMKPLLAER